MNLDNLSLNPNLIKAVKEIGFVEFTDIQEKCIPVILEGKDIFGQSKTGSGKTAGFGLPILHTIKSGNGIQALILTPTRELCVQVTEALNSFSKYSGIKSLGVYGGVSINPQIDLIRKADIIVGTPGRVQDHINRRTISFPNLKYLVLDEADKMFEMGFLEAVEEILKSLPKKRQTLLFSATLSKNVIHIVNRHLKSPVMIKSQEYVEKHLLKQVAYTIPFYDKFSLLVHLLKQDSSNLVLIFCATRRGVDSLTKNLRMQGVKALAIHGGLTQNRRQDALDQLKKERISVLVATDVASHGLDIKNITHIYNYDLPKTLEEYIHRIGRTARAGMKGDAITLVAEKDYKPFNSMIFEGRLEIQEEELPEFQKIHYVKNTQDRGRRQSNFPQRRRFGNNYNNRRRY